MNKLDKKQLLFLKKNYFTSKQKTLCKKFEQTGGAFSFIIDGKNINYHINNLGLIQIIYLNLLKTIQAICIKVTMFVSKIDMVKLIILKII